MGQLTYWLFQRKLLESILNAQLLVQIIVQAKRLKKMLF